MRLDANEMKSVEYAPIRFLRSLLSIQLVLDLLAAIADLLDGVFHQVLEDAFLAGLLSDLMILAAGKPCAVLLATSS